MEFLIDDPNIEAQFRKIFSKLRPIMNGETYQKMRNYGVNYSKAMGVSVVHLRELAKEYEPNHLLAHKLWVKGFRETRIMATLLEEPSMVTQEQLERWVGDIEFPELVEQLSMNLLVHLTWVEELIMQWIVSDMEWKRCAAVQTAGRLSILQKGCCDAFLLRLVHELPLGDCSGFYKKSLQRNLGKMGRFSPVLKKEILFLLQNRDKLEGWNQVAEDVRYELDL